MQGNQRDPVAWVDCRPEEHRFASITSVGVGVVQLHIHALVRAKLHADFHALAAALWSILVLPERHSRRIGEEENVVADIGQEQRTGYFQPGQRPQTGADLVRPALDRREVRIGHPSPANANNSSVVGTRNPSPQLP